MPVKIQVMMMVGLLSAASLVWAVEYTGQSGRDPFEDRNKKIQAAPVVTAQGSEEYILNGVVWSEIEPRAIVNGKLVRKGSKVGEAQVVLIEKDSVQLSRDGNVIVVRQGGKKTNG